MSKEISFELLKDIVKTIYNGPAQTAVLVESLIKMEEAGYTIIKKQNDFSESFSRNLEKTIDFNNHINEKIKTTKPPTPRGQDNED